jgi:hypothetical protein
MPRNEHFLPRNNGNHSEYFQRNFFGTKFSLPALLVRVVGEEGGVINCCKEKGCMGGVGGGVGCGAPGILFRCFELAQLTGE